VRDHWTEKEEGVRVATTDLRSEGSEKGGGGEIIFHVFTSMGEKGGLLENARKERRVYEEGGGEANILQLLFEKGYQRKHPRKGDWGAL